MYPQNSRHSNQCFLLFQLAFSQHPTSWNVQLSICCITCFASIRWREPLSRMWCKKLSRKFFIICGYSSAHEWFQKDLPNYLFPPINESEASIVDIEAVREVTEVPYSSKMTVLTVTSLFRGTMLLRKKSRRLFSEMIHTTICPSRTTWLSTTSASPTRLPSFPSRSSIKWHRIRVLDRFIAILSALQVSFSASNLEHMIIVQLRSAARSLQHWTTPRPAEQIVTNVPSGISEFAPRVVPKTSCLRCSERWSNSIWSGKSSTHTTSLFAANLTRRLLIHQRCRCSCTKLTNAATCLTLRAWLMKSLDVSYFHWNDHPKLCFSGQCVIFKTCFNVNASKAGWNPRNPYCEHATGHEHGGEYWENGGAWFCGCVGESCRFLHYFPLVLSLFEWHSMVWNRKCICGVSPRKTLSNGAMANFKCFSATWPHRRLQAEPSSHRQCSSLKSAPHSLELWLVDSTRPNFTWRNQKTKCWYNQDIPLTVKETRHDNKTFTCKNRSSISQPASFSTYKPSNFHFIPIPSFSSVLCFSCYVPVSFDFWFVFFRNLQLNKWYLLFKY